MNRLRRAADPGDPLACLGHVRAAVMRPHADRRRGSAGGVRAPRGSTSLVQPDGACVSQRTTVGSAAGNTGPRRHGQTIGAPATKGEGSAVRAGLFGGTARASGRCDARTGSRRCRGRHAVRPNPSGRRSEHDSRGSKSPDPAGACPRWLENPAGLHERMKRGGGPWSGSVRLESPKHPCLATGLPVRPVTSPHVLGIVHALSQFHES